MSERILFAHWHGGIPVGQFIENAAGQVRFEYDPSYRGIPLSVSLPLPPARTAPSAAAHFLDNLLPTPSTVRQELAHYQLQKGASAFALLSAIGSECPGRLVLAKPGSAANSSIESYGKLLQGSFERWFTNRARQPLMPDANGSVGHTLAGSRPKAALNCHGDESVRVPRRAGSSTHIVKAPGINDEPGAVYEEWFCLKLAKELLGRDQVASADIWRACLRLRRYDRETVDQRITRIHQEDFAQALGLSSVSSRADPVDAGPEHESLLARAAGLIDQLGREGRMAVPALQKGLFFRQLLVRLLFADAGLGLKKFSLIHHRDGRSELAPIYGLRCGSFGKDSSSITKPECGILIGRVKHTEPITEQACIECATRQLGLTARHASAEFSRLKQSLVRKLLTRTNQHVKQQPAAASVVEQIRMALLERLA